MLQEKYEPKKHQLSRVRNMIEGRFHIVRNMVFICLFAVIANVSFSQTPFQSGSLVVLRVGDGSVSRSHAAMPVFIDEYSTTGKLIRSISVPTTDTGDNHPLTLSGNNAYEGLLSLSEDAQMLSFAGYNAAVGMPKVSTATNEWVIGLIDASGRVNTSTGLSMNNKGSVTAAVADGTNVWVAGVAPNLYHVTIGATKAKPVLAGTIRGIRGLAIYDQHLYASQSSLKGRSPVVQVGEGLPLVGKQKLVTLPGMPINGALASGRQFVFADLDAGILGNDVLYVANDGQSDGITKYTLINGNWMSNGTIPGQFIGLTGVVSGDQVMLYTVKYGGGGAVSKIYSIQDDTGYNGDFSGSTLKPLAVAPSKTMFRGLALSPQTSETK